MTTYKGNVQTSQAKAAAKAKRESAKLKLRTDLLDAQKQATSDLMEKARNVGISAARLVHKYPDGGDIDIFRRILENRIQRSQQVGRVYAIVATRAYWAELCRLIKDGSSSQLD